MSDLISRQAAIDALKGLPTWWADGGGYYGGAQPPMVALLDPEDAVSAIENLQAQLPKRGMWVEENRRPRSSQFVCSECHRTAYDPQPTRDKAWRKRCRYAYCPNCGAKMEEGNG